MIDSRVLARAVLGSLAAVIVLTGVVGWEKLWTRLQEPNPYSLRKVLLLSSIQMVRDQASHRLWDGDVARSLSGLRAVR